MIVGTPHELDGVTDGSVHRERNVAEDALGRSDNDSMSCTRALVSIPRVGGSWGVRGRRSAIRSNAFYNDFQFQGFANGNQIDLR